MTPLKTLAAIAVVSTAAWAQRAAPPAAPAPPAPPAAPAPPAMPMMGMGLFGGAPGIPPAIAQKIGISQDTVKKVRDLSFDANEQLITLEADLKRAQLELEKAMSQPTPDDSTVMQRLETIAKAELAVRKNRVGLMLKIRKAVGPDAWEKLQAEMPGHMGMVGPGTRREVRIIRHADGREDVQDDIRGE